jgi:hypothetical protein
MSDLLWMWNDRDLTHSAVFGWGSGARQFCEECAAIELLVARHHCLLSPE